MNIFSCNCIIWKFSAISYCILSYCIWSGMFLLILRKETIIPLGMFFFPQINVGCFSMNENFVRKIPFENTTLLHNNETKCPNFQWWKNVLCLIVYFHFNFFLLFKIRLYSFGESLNKKWKRWIEFVFRFKFVFLCSKVYWKEEN